MNDLISRRAVLNELPHANWGKEWDEALARAIIESVPTIDSVKHGKWVDFMTEEWCTFDECKCSVCGVVEYFNKGWKKFSYCPNCGARMDEVENERAD